MSRIGKNPISLPQGVKVSSDAQLLKVEGPKGKLSREVRPEIKIVVKEGELSFERNLETKEARAFHGLERSLAYNMVVGVSEGFEKQLALVGAVIEPSLKENLIYFLGYSHHRFLTTLRHSSFDA
ncbi:UNVERIFIED_CONTAM: hypothetical protein GTU68_047076 [Idotea baltica]|nr:hypothetical protein [Idotea baltica]